jgi:NAD(P)-dependent dehydrogenase (short-subunit alcohol dehydrogenase family)
VSTAQLSGKIIVVTGGTQGLGEAIARHLVEQGVAGMVICGRNRANGQRVSGALEAAGCPTLYVSADLSEEMNCREVIRACDTRFGRVDGLVNVAADTTRGTLENSSVALWDYQFAVNARAPFILMQEAVGIMKREGTAGSIVNIISMSCYAGEPYLTPYCASKGALATLTKNLANALLPDRIRVNGVNIGWMSTLGEHVVQKAMGQPDNWLELADAKCPFGRLLRPSDPVKLVALLLSDNMEMMTGSLIDFDQTVGGARP